MATPETQREPAEQTAILLDTLGDARLTVVEPFALSSHEEAGFVVVVCDELDDFGYGDDLPEAVWHFQKSVVELYFALNEDQDRLGPAMQELRAKLTRKVRKADAA